jgi:transcriptional regulator with XRE-family HTH domain
MTPEQCRAARAWLDWTQTELADRSALSLATVKDFEKGKRRPHPNNLAAIQAALEKAGIGLVDGEPSGITFAKSL